jgi:tetratricopeptide (TPR) repeat protein
MHECGEPSSGADAILRADWYALLGGTAAYLRDFDAADAWLSRARELAPSHAWIHVCRASALEHEDRYEEALTAARRALELRPRYCSAVMCVSHLLTLLDRDTEAVQLLTETAEHVESMWIAAQLYAAYMELRQYELARGALDRCEMFAPLADRAFRRWLEGQRSDLAYHRGDVPGAIRHAKNVRREFYDRVAARLEKNCRTEPRSRLLPVGFVRQYRMTCAPATLSAIGRFWSEPVDHLQVAEEICYDGTPDYRGRNWAESQGWRVREFTVDEPSAFALLDRGVPFTLATVDATSAHLQAVIGYDDRRGTLWIRDPFIRNSHEVIAEELLERYKAHGPHGMALVPSGESARLDGVDLRDAPLWDRLHELDEALARHDRDTAAQIHGEMCAAADGHWLSCTARHRLACYDANPVERLASLKQLLQLSPDDRCWQFHHLACLRDLAGREERLARYRDLCEQRDVPPAFLQQYAQELQADFRQHGEAVSLLHRAIRRSPCEAGHYYVLANVLWDRRRFEEAFELYRFAACLDDKDESFAESYFRAARWFKRTEGALDFLRGRFHRFGKRSSLSARTLVQAYLQCERTTEALETLEEAMRLRPDDGDLMLFAADTYLMSSRESLPLAARLLEQAKSIAAEMQWLPTAARLASRDGRPIDALGFWRRLLEIQPLAVDAHQSVAQLLLDTKGKDSAVSHLTDAANRFPHYLPLQRIWLQWVSDEPPESREPAIRRVAAMSPHDAWVHRELAIFLIGERRFEEADHETRVAGELDAHDPCCRLLRAQLLRESGKIQEAKEELRKAIRLSVDYSHAIDEAISLCTAPGERREVLEFVREELVRQVTFGDGLLTFRRQALGTLEPAELLAVLREALDARPDLWHAWSACVQQLLTLEELDEGWNLVRQATERFPLLPVLWLDRAAVCQARQDWAGERDSLETAYQINPDWGPAVRSLADCLERQGEFGDARRMLEQAIARRPQETDNQIMLAEFLWRQKDHDFAFDTLRDAVEGCPGSTRAWNDFRNLAVELARQSTVIEVARTLTERRGSEARSWFLLAESLDAPEQLDERLEALERTIARAPRFVTAHESKAIALAGARRWDEARNACFPPCWGENAPVALRARAIWLLAAQGKVQEAIVAMRALLAEEPGHDTGWCWLWEWCRELKDYAGCIEAGEALVRINPQYEVSLGYLAESHHLARNLDEAAELFQRAFDLNPRYQYAGFNLFDFQLAQGRLDAAAETLCRLQKHDNSPLVRVRAIQLAANQGIELARRARASLTGRVVHFFGMAPAGQRQIREIAIDQFQLLCTSRDDNPWPVSTAVDAMIGAGWQRDAERILKDSLQSDRASTEVGRQWVRLATVRGQWSLGAFLRKAAAQGKAGEEAAAAYITRLVESKRRWRFRGFLWRHKTWLHAGDESWGTVTYALCSFDWHRRLVRWAADWHQRKDVRSWMLINLVESLRALKRDDDAAEVGRYALTLCPDHTQDLHRVWLAADAVCEGKMEVAQGLLDVISQESLNNPAAFVADVVAALVEMAGAPAERTEQAFRAAQDRLRRARKRFPLSRHGPARRRFYRRCVRWIAERRGGVAARIWAELERYGLMS